MISFRHKGNYSKATRYFERLREVVRLGVLDKYGRAGVDALSSATPLIREKPRVRGATKSNIRLGRPESYLPIHTLIKACPSQ